MLLIVSFFYFCLKLGVYSYWCRVGLQRLLHEVPGGLLKQAVRLGVIRLIIGFVVGFFVWEAAQFVNDRIQSLIITYIESSIIAYLLVYIPIRWIEWGIMEGVIYHKFFPKPSLFKWYSLLTGVNMKSRKWRLGGIVVSCFADAPLFLIGGVLTGEVGRILC